MLLKIIVETTRSAFNHTWLQVQSPTWVPLLYTQAERQNWTIQTILVLFGEHSLVESSTGQSAFAADQDGSVTGQFGDLRSVMGTATNAASTVNAHHYTRALLHSVRALYGLRSANVLTNHPTYSQTPSQVTTGVCSSPPPQILHPSAGC